MTREARYTMRILGAAHTLLTRRRGYRVQGIGKLAAVSIPTSEMRRLLAECGGNLEKLLSPMRNSLNSLGYSDLFILPSQTTVVELVAESAAVQDDDSEPIYPVSLLDAIRTLVPHVNRCMSLGSIDHEFKVAFTTFMAVVAQHEVERWR